MSELPALPDFELPATGNQRFRLSAYPAPFVLYFYPKDDTPGCTNEGMQFRDLYPEFVKLKVGVFGVSRDTVASHEKFKAKYGFPFELLSDTDEELSQGFGVIKLKNMYGKKVLGIERSTFVIDRSGRIRRQWRGVKVPGHAAEVLEFVRSADL